MGGPFSVVMPTLWRSARTVPLLQALDRCPLVGEIQLVDNANEARPPLPPLEKLRVTNPGRNVYVNPAWNLGVRKASRPLLGLVNDDVTFDVEALLAFVLHHRKRLGCFGIHPASFDPDATPTPIRLEAGNHLADQWACVLFLQRRHYVPVPQELRIWYGDDWIASHVRPVQSLHTRVETEHGTSVRDPAFQRVLDEDRRRWRARHKWRALLRDPARGLRRAGSVMPALKRANPRRRA